jgi:hypothetical protein
MDIAVTHDEVFIQMWNVPLSSGCCTPARRRTDGTTARTGDRGGRRVVVWAAAFAVLGALWTRYSRRANIAASSLLGLAPRRWRWRNKGIAAVRGRCDSAATLDLLAAIVFTVYVFWSVSRAVPTIRYASGALAISRHLGGMADMLHTAGVQPADVCDERRLDTVASLAAAHDRRAGALVVQPRAAHVMDVPAGV